MSTENIYRVIETLQKTAPIGILCFGTIGNILSLLILSRPKTRRFSTTVFLIVLNVVDIIALWSGLLRILFIGYLQTDIRDVNNVLCKLHVFLVYVSTHISSWLIVGVTLERVACVWMPVKMHLGRNNKAALIGTSLTLFTFILADLHLLIGFELVPMEYDYLNETVLRCQPAISPGYKDFVDNIWPWVDMSILFLLPFCVIIIGNILIVSRVRMRSYKRKQQFPDTYRHSAESSSLYFLTALLVTLNVVFVVCVAPITIFLIGQYTWWPGQIYTEKDLAISQLCWLCVNLLVYINYALNFILYLACGPKFREELKSMALCLGFRNKKPIMQDPVALTRSSSSGGSGSSIVPTTDILSIDQ